MQQQISVITLGISDVERSKHFYREGFGWKPAFENDEIVFYQMNRFVLGTWVVSGLEANMTRPGLMRPGAFALAYNVPTQADVATVLAQLERAGSRMLREADAPVHGGYRGYIADPDDHAWEIAWNPA